MMTTRLDADLRRELTISGSAYTLTLTPRGFTLAIKGHRKGVSLQWEDLINGDAALAVALNASMQAAPPKITPPKASVGKRRPKNK